MLQQIQQDEVRPTGERGRTDSRPRLFSVMRLRGRPDGLRSVDDTGAIGVLEAPRRSQSQPVPGTPEPASGCLECGRGGMSGPGLPAIRPAATTVGDGRVATTGGARVAESDRSGADAGDAGMSTVEYAVGTVVAAAFAAVLYRIVTGDSVISGLTDLINTALSTSF